MFLCSSKTPAGGSSCFCVAVSHQQSSGIYALHVQIMLALTWWMGTQSRHRPCWFMNVFGCAKHSGCRLWCYLGCRSR